MKILIIGFTKIKYMPYLDFYLNGIDSKRNHVDIIYWNRDLKSEETTFLNNCYLHEFSVAQKDEVMKIKKIISFYKYKNYVQSFLKENYFDLVVVMHSLPAVLIKKTLISKFNKKYILDYRDLTYERNIIFKKIIASLVEHSQLTFVSSNGFRNFLPKTQQCSIVTSHNYNPHDLVFFNNTTDFIVPNTLASKSRIKISFWGFVRNKKLNKTIIERIGNDNRFELHFYGREQKTVCYLKQIVQKKHFKNIFFHGEYNPKDRWVFIKNSDIIHNIYDDNNMLFAMSNKFYDGIIFKKPQLCFKGSLMANRVSNSSVGLSCNPYNDDFCDCIFNYFSSLKQDIFLNSCEKELNSVIEEYNYGIKLLKQMTSEFKNDSEYN